MIIWKPLLGALCGSALGYVGAWLAPRWMERPPGRWARGATIVATALLTGLLAARHGLGSDFWPLAFFTGLLVTASLVDLHDRIIPNELVLAGLVVGILWLLLLPHPTLSWLQAIGGAFAGSGALLVLALLVKGGMGLGDVKLAAVIGLFLGVRWVGLGLLLAFLAGGLFSAVLILLRRVGRRDTIPFGPFLAMGAVLTLLYGEALWAWYYGLY